MEKYCKSCGKVFDDLKFKICPYCGGELGTRYGRQPIPRELRHEVFKRDGYRCCECGASKNETSLEIDHIIPVAKGGTNDIDNLQTLCRECNRMKHTDEWVGGETDLESVKKELDSLKKQIETVKGQLKKTTNENDKIDYQYQLMKLEERRPFIEKEYEELYKKNKELEEEIRKKEKRKQNYKKLYVKIDEKAFLKWSKDNSVEYDTKEKFINYACELSEDKINDYIYTMGLYKELIEDNQKLNVYDSLFNEIDYESQYILNDYISQDYSKGLLILICLNQYGETKIKSIISEEKKRWQKLVSDERKKNRKRLNEERKRKQRNKKN